MRISESDTDNAISINMIHVETDYEPSIYEQPIHSHIYQNHDHFLLNYYTRALNKKIKRKHSRINYRRKACRMFYQNLPKETQPEEKIPFLLESSKKEEF